LGSGQLLFNHESPLRPERFVTQKVVAAACRIAEGSSETLHLGDITIKRDWGWAPEYVQAMHLMLQQEQPEDYVIATGTSYALRDFVAATFAYLGLDWEKHVVTEPTLFRPIDITAGKGNPKKAQQYLGWRAQYTMNDIVPMMVDACLGKPVQSTIAFRR
jgi:GDPmannose 4,6-dehydratase